MRPEIETKLGELSLALKFSLANLDHAGTRRDVKKAQSILRELRALLATEQAPRELYTCIDKGGRYELLGSSTGAGSCRREGRVVYRCLDTGQLYHRTDEDFASCAGVGALRKDAERYRWLRDHGALCRWEEGDTEVCNHHGFLDEAVDESITKAKGGEE